mgnify:CR=1 FL=1
MRNSYFAVYYNYHFNTGGQFHLKLILGIIGGVVVVGSIAVAMIHFWDDLKKLLPCFGKCDEGLDDFDEIEA